MLMRWALAFLVLAVIVAFIGLGGMSLISAGIARIIGIVILAVLAPLIYGLIGRQVT
jgi:uncharacterized membrane protein YtjA (UPF0391 family)